MEMEAENGGGCSVNLYYKLSERLFLIDYNILEGGACIWLS